MSEPGETDQEILTSFLPPVSAWFRATLGSPTPPQRMSWPEIAAGRNTLIVAPTGSGKTLAAFLAALDHLWRTPRQTRGVRILYISPLKALNEDVRHNLRIPLDGILGRAEAMGTPLAPLAVALRSGDTPAAERARIVRRPPDILITTPESLHLMLTSRAREVLRGVSHVIVDEIHAVCGNKRGVFLSLLLERLEAICPRPFVRVGLSATQRPLEEVARYLGGQRVVDRSPAGARLEPRPVTIIDAGRRKEMDLKVLWPGSDRGQFIGPAGTTWPAIEDRLLGLVSGHRSTIIFANNRRTVEKLTTRLNELAGDEANGPASPGEDDDDPTPDDGIGPFRPHHGSLSLEERRATEAELKGGKLKGVVSTASLELGIDMGDVDLVCQVESPGNVARGLQRVGRAGHVVGGISKGRLIAKTASDLLETAALARAMVAGEIEPLHVPANCLDVLAQQVVACVAVERWEVPALFELVRRAYPFAALPAEAFEGVLRMISGRFPTGSFRDLRARVAWDRVHNRLAALPGTARLAVTGGGTIPDTGQYPVFLGDGGPRLGELDEEFIFERRVGEAFALGSSTWRIDAIEPHRVIVGRAEGQAAVMPFWRGESSPRSPELGHAVGALSREVAGRLEDPALHEWLGRECLLEPPAARNLVHYIARQRQIAGAVPDDRTILVESFQDQAGELCLAVLSPFGGTLHQGLKIALLGRIRRRLGLVASCLHGDGGLLFRLPQMDEPPLDILAGLTADEAEELIRTELPDTALFGLRFRQNASRALLMPRPDPARRTPLWLQRLRSKDLLQVARQFPDFPILVETYRECLDDDLQIPRLRAFLDSVRAGSIRVVTRSGEIASPFASDLVFQFAPAFLYEWDDPRRNDARPPGSVVDPDLLDPLLHGASAARLLDPRAVGQVENRLRSRGHPPRSVEEMAETLRLLGDLTESECHGPMPHLLAELTSQGRAVAIELPRTTEPRRTILFEEGDLYRAAFPARGVGEPSALEMIVRRHLRTHALVGLAELIGRYPVDPEVAAELLERWVEDGGVVRLDGSEGTRWADRENLAEARRLTVAILRKEAVAVAPEVFADFLVRRQHAHPGTRLEGPDGLERVLDRLRGFPAAAEAWEGDLLPRRVKGYRADWLDALFGGGGWLWRAGPGVRDDPAAALVPRDFAGSWPAPTEPGAGADPTGGDVARTLEILTARGANFATDLARHSGLEPSRVRSALRVLLLEGRATNDRFDPLRPGAFDTLTPLLEAANGQARSRRGLPRRSFPGRPEGRWSAIEDAEAGPEDRLLTWIEALLDRYGVLARELLKLEPWAPPWSELLPLLARAELRGEIRRGYFVEGFSGVQYAAEDAVEELGRLGSIPPSGMHETMLSASDPANLYGAGAPLDIPLLEGGTVHLGRGAGNFLVLRDGRPVLVIEAFGKRLTGLASAPAGEIDAALARLLELSSTARPVLKVETYNGKPALSSPAAGRLAQLGFVRDYPGMTYYATWGRPGADPPEP